MKDFITIDPISHVTGSIKIPGSKSISNRALLLSALSEGKTTLKNMLDCDDTKYMLEALKMLGIKYSFKKQRSICYIYGNRKSFKQRINTQLFLGNAGTAFRSLTAILSIYNDDVIITGNQRMQERPIRDLISALIEGGAKIEYCGKKIGFPPIHIKKTFTGGKISINGNISSQFLSSLLIAAPLAKVNTTITIKKILASSPYVNMTIKMMKSFGIEIKNKNYQCFYIKGNQKYTSPKLYNIESDVSSATYFLAAAAIKGKDITIKNLYPSSIQGDIFFIDVLKKMGAIIFWGKNYVTCYKGKLKSIDMDLNNIPDAAMTLAIVALFASGTTIIRNIYNWRVKETDRLQAMTKELIKIGATVKEGYDFISITPPKKFISEKIYTYDDHRIAMCFSLIALAEIPIKILNPGCTSKTFPKFFSVLKKVCVYK